MNRRLIVGIAAPLLAVLAYSGWIMSVARGSAVRTAAGRPFCIQVATWDGYRELSSITQLAGLRMRGRSALNHAVLVVGDLRQPQLFHWSYEASSFVEGAYGPPPIYCRPRHNSFDSLDQSAERDQRVLFIAYGGHQFLIPRAYRPRLTWPQMSMLLNARAPRFEPTNGMQEGNLVPTVSVDLHSTPILESWRRLPDHENRIEPLGTAYGLTKERITHSASRNPHLQYYQLRPDGRVATLIVCVSERPEFQCEQLFEWNGMSFFFNFMPRDIPRWHEVQNNLRALIGSFEVIRSDH